jgi:S1-C subfamily serine protease
MTRYFLAACALLAVGLPVQASSPEDSIVKILTKIRGPNVLRPWTKAQPFEVEGTGVVIEGNKILTNAHLVHYAEEVEVQFRPGQRKYPARVEGVGLDMDLAVLSVQAKDFFSKHPPLPRSKKVPTIRDNVTFYGFPVGGDDLAVSRGLIARIEHGKYDYRGFGLRIQVSAPINPGNSGGPALVDGQMVGLVFGRGEGQNVGYVVPNEEINLFLEDIKDGRYDGKALLPGGMTYQAITNKTLREMLKLDDEVTGVMLSPSTTIPKNVPLQPLDVITHIGPYSIDEEGMVRVPGRLGRMPFREVAHTLAEKENKVPFTVIRQGKALTVHLPVSTRDTRLIREFRGEQPSYFLYGPLVFSPARLDAISIYRRMNPLMSYLQSPLIVRVMDQQRFPGEELVVVTRPMFAHKCVKGYEDPAGYVLQAINGQPIKNLKHLVEVLRDLEDPYVKIRFAERHSGILILPRAEMEKVTQEVMEENGIPTHRRMSADVRAIWKKTEKADKP